MTNLSARVEAFRSKGKKSNLAQVAYDQIKEAIVTAKLKPGDSISENMLASVLEMSRTPVREALKELESENLVGIMPGRGAFVKDISLKDLREIFELRRELECFAADSAIQNITGAEIQELENVWLSFKEQVRQQKQIEWETISRSDNQLHTLIINKCNNSHLKGFMGVLSQQILRYQLLTAQALGDLEDTIRQHLEIIALIKAKNTEKLIPALREHIEAAEKIIIRSHF